MKSIKEMWYRKEIMRHERNVARTHYNFESAMAWGAKKVIECQSARSLCEKFDDEWHRNAVKTKRKEVREAKEWAIQKREASKNAQRDYQEFKDKHGLMR